ncbi:MAG: CoB--CoM heterodisulfide reductase iron-sulfur subunit A family protein [Anaerolineae bacterium]|nr:CoB--CoM heterodisulfide reductase iron-sulfur subunit A family protein [Anaerolineae bacterium]
MVVRKIGVFVCHCGLNIAGTIDVQRVVEEIKKYPGVAFATDYKYMCSDPGQALIREAVADYGLDGVVVAACSPAMHEVTFRKTARAAGVNPYLTEIANIREQISWVHQTQPEEATRKAIETIATIIEKVRYDEALEPFSLPLVKRALVIGGGIAGMTAALHIADAGYPVVLVEREAQLGGKMRQLSGLYLNFDAAPDLLETKIAAVMQHPNIQVLTNAEVVELGGYVGNFTVKVSSGFQVPGSRLQVPGSETAQSGINLAPETRNLEPETQNPEPETFTFDIGAIVVATGFDLLPKSELGEYGGGRPPDVIDGLQFERMLAGGEIRRPSDGAVPKEVVWVQCAGSRDPELHMPYCSKICCMYVAKQAIAYKQRVPDGQAYVFYIDIRSQGKGYEEFVQRAMSEYDVLYLRGKVARVFEEDGRVVVYGVDTLSGKAVEVQADLVVLATAVVPSTGARDLAQRLRVSTDEYGFFSEAHPKLRPVESLTAGIFLAGAAQFPKDIPETVAQASGAAAKVLGLFAQQEMVQEPTIAFVDEELCAGCGLCVAACPYEARVMHSWKPIAVVQTALCQGCGACVVACPNKASSLRNLSTEQLLAMMEPVL